MESPTRATESVRKAPEISSLGFAAPLRATESAKPAAIEFSDTTVFRTPTLALDPQHRERERILPPSAAGPLGSAYKMLRTQVLRRLDQLHANTLAVLSPTAGAGKTLTAINLAIAIAAESGRTALLVDLDLRHPCVAPRFGIAQKIGVEECLRTRRSVHEAMVKITGYDRLTILPAIERIEHSSELLAERRCAELIAEMRTRYTNRIVIFDLPPVLQADDALVVSRHVQAGLIVVGEGRSRRDDVVRTMELLRDTKIVGTVLNASRESERTYY